MMKLFSKNSNLCDHNSPTLQTDRQTDRQTTCDRNTALCTKVHRAVMMYRLIKWLSPTVAVIMWHCSVSQASSRLVAWCRKADSVTICDRQAGLFDKHQSRSCWCRRHAASEAAASLLRRVYRSGEIRLARPRAASRPHYCHTTRQTID